VGDADSFFVAVCLEKQIATPNFAKYRAKKKDNFRRDVIKL